MKMTVARDDLLIWASPSFSVLDDSKAHTRALLARRTGLSLYIPRKIVEAHRGSLSSKNNEDGGATFAFKLPTDLEPTVFYARTDNTGG